MIFDSHAHYSRYQYNQNFRVWRALGDGFAVEDFTRNRLFERMNSEGIIGYIEPSVDFESIPAQWKLAETYPDYVHVAVGVHPTRCFLTKWKNRKRLEEYLKQGKAVAVGETGLDYHYPRRKQHRLRQKMWFVYQIKLADRMNLPLILHVREADRDALIILKKYQDRLHGGVAHCFTGDADTAEKYISLGFALGIGGAVLNGDERAIRIRDVVEKIPLTSILLETDAPYVSPENAGLELRRKRRAKICNSSLILPAVAGKIAEIKGISIEEVEKVTTENSLRIFGIS